MIEIRAVRKDGKGPFRKTRLRKGDTVYLFKKKEGTSFSFETEDSINFARWHTAKNGEEIPELMQFYRNGEQCFFRLKDISVDEAAIIVEMIAAAAGLGIELVDESQSPDQESVKWRLIG